MKPKDVEPQRTAFAAPPQAARPPAATESSVNGHPREAWELGPPPNRFDDGAPDIPPRELERERTKDAERVVTIVQAEAELFHDSKQAAYAAFRRGKRRVVQRLRARTTKSWIARTVRMHLDRSVATAAIDEALVTLEGIALCDRDQRVVHVRVASHEGAIFLDIGDDTGACVAITAMGWRVIGEPPVMFRRPDAMRPLPCPVPGGRLDDLRRFVNLEGDNFYLLVAWLVAAFRPGRPFPILALHGEQGTAKSTAARVARGLVDPNGAPLRSAPRSEDDLAVAALHSHVVAFDNLSGVQPWLSDALCRLATGGGLSKRTLYTDDEETVLDAIRPVVVNGIDDLANRADLAERSLVLTLRPLSRAQRRDEQSFWQDFEWAAPRILGVLLDGVASALRREPGVQLGELPRMADFAKWIMAAESGLGLPAGTLLGAYDRNRSSVVDATLDASPVAVAVRVLLDAPRGSRWEGTPAQALEALSGVVPESTKRNPSWPKSPRALRQALRRNATFLRSADIETDLDAHAGRGSDKRRVYRFSKVAPTVPTVPTSPGAQSTEGSHPSDASSERPRATLGRSAAGDAGTMGTVPPVGPNSGARIDKEEAGR